MANDVAYSPSYGPTTKGFEMQFYGPNHGGYFYPLYHASTTDRDNFDWIAKWRLYLDEITMEPSGTTVKTGVSLSVVHTALVTFDWSAEIWNLYLDGEFLGSEAFNVSRSSFDNVSISLGGSADIYIDNVYLK